MSEVMRFDPDQRQMIGVRRVTIGSLAGPLDVCPALCHQGLERCAKAQLQSEPLDRDALLDPEQNATLSIVSCDTDTALIAGVSTVKFEHSVLWSLLWSSAAFRVSHHIWSLQSAETS
jgi:hypothetical protein